MTEQKQRGPAIILVRPQMGENIGAAARVMLNFALGDLRLVSPRDGWPNEKAVAMASRATQVIEGVRVFETTAEAVADLQHVYAATARNRDMVKPMATPRQAASALRSQMAGGETCGVLFGPERAGLDNDDVVLADTVLTVPLNPEFSSLNLAQAVALVAYECFVAGGEPVPPLQLSGEATRTANKNEMLGLFEHLESALDDAGYFDRVLDKRPSMVRNLRNMLQRASLLEQDVRTLRGVIKGLRRNRQ